MPNDQTRSRLDRLIIGLGNPGPGYERHRHNVGFMAVGLLAARVGAAPPVLLHRGLYSTARVHDRTVGLLAPTTFMNGSGESVSLAWAAHPELGPSDVLVVHDDLDLPLGRLRMRGSGGAGGQRGLADVLEVMGTRDVPRLRIGIGRPPEGCAVRDWVLSDFRAEEAEPLRDVLSRSAEAMTSWVEVGLDRTMDVVNRAATADEAR
jgi:PTH1 family peptidyl-tRNA hydrolase